MSTKLRWTVGFLIVVLMVTAGGTFFKAMVPQSTGLQIKVGQNQVCSVQDNGAGTTIAGYSPMMGVNLREMTTEAQPKPVQPKTVTTLAKPKQPAELISAPGSLGAASSMTLDDSGLERGLALSSCLTPSTTHWFVGASSSKTEVTSLYFTNIDATQADIDISIFGPSGRISAQGSRSVIVRPKSTVSVSLESLFKNDSAVTVLAQATTGRVAAFARIKGLAGPGEVSGKGIEWVPSSPDLDHTVLVPGVSAKAGGLLYVVNPHDRPTQATVKIMGKDGTFNPVGAENISINRESTLIVDLTTALGSESATIKIESAQPIAAAMRVGPKQDIALAGGAAPFRGRAVFPLTLPNGDAQVILSNPGTAEVMAKLGQLDQDGAAVEPEKEIKVLPGATVTVALPRKPAQVVEVTPKSGELVGAVVVAQDTGGLAGLSIAALSAQSGEKVTSDPQHDHQVPS